MENREYKLIPMDDIRPGVRELAVAWAEANKYDWIGDKHKLASDIQNYADSYLQEFVDKQNPSYTPLLKRKANIELGLSDIISNGIYTGEEADITVVKIYKAFIEPMLLLIEMQKQNSRQTKV